MAPRFFLVLDFEATCEDNDRKWVNEIIEFPVVLVDAANFKVVDEFRSMVRPTERPTLTAFCTLLTCITQAQVDAAQPLAHALREFEAWLSKHGLLETPTAVLPITCGDWDLMTQLPRECRRKSLRVPQALRRWCNIKKTFAAATGGKAGGMARMLSALKLTLQGHHHLGIDDARNIARIAITLAQRGAEIAPTGGDCAQPGEEPEEYTSVTGQPQALPREELR